jgi:hypothetical protein
MQTDKGRNPILDGLDTEEEAARQLNKSPRTLKRWRGARWGPPFIMIGNRVYYRREAVREWLLALERRMPRPEKCEAA